MQVRDPLAEGLQKLLLSLSGNYGVGWASEISCQEGAFVYDMSPVTHDLAIQLLQSRKRPEVCSSRYTLDVAEEGEWLEAGGPLLEPLQHGEDQRISRTLEAL